ncbi:uncharacterized protein LOC142984248 [Anticarsia gemmatalis]|uniref:uncharacterized protein LOC142984248 n=1 Tax=Anticarsia gemmatalis TaxID=129554 RepID=UPI003F76E806
MLKINIVVVICLVVFSSVLAKDLTSKSNSDSIEKSFSSEEEDEYELESRRDYDKTSEKEKELKLTKSGLRNLKEGNYRRALESILPGKDSAGYRRFFEDLINGSLDNSKTDPTRKKVEEVVVTDTFEDRAGDEGKEFDPQVDEIEVVIEHITDSENQGKDGSDDLSKSVDSSSAGRSGEISEATTQEQPFISKTPDNLNLNNKGRSAAPDNEEVVPSPSIPVVQVPDQRQIEPYPVNRISEVVFPRYRTTLTRSGVVVSPTLFTVQTTAPVVDPATSRSWQPNRRFNTDFGRNSGITPGHTEYETKLIDDYNDYGANTYTYSPTRGLVPSRKSDSKPNVLPNFAENLYRPSPMGLPLFRNGYLPQNQRYFGERPLFRFRR